MLAAIEWSNRIEEAWNDDAAFIPKLIVATIVYSVGLIVVIQFGVGGIWAARDRFWPAVYNQVSSDAKKAPTSVE